MQTVLTCKTFENSIRREEKVKFLNDSKKAYLSQNAEEKFSKWLEKTLLKSYPATVNTVLQKYELDKEGFCAVNNKNFFDDINWSEVETSLEKQDWYSSFNAAVKLSKENAYDTKMEQIDISLAYQIFVLWAHHQVTLFIEKNQMEDLVSIDSFSASLIESLLTNLNGIALRSIVLELHISKIRKELKGNTSEERFKDFIKTKFMNIESAIEFYSEYAPLTRLLMNRTNYFIDNIQTFLIRLKEDFSEMKNYFGLSALKVKSLSVSLGDSHRKGNSVIQVIFDNEEKLIYKPRNLDINTSFMRFMDWIYQTDDTIPKQKFYKVLCKDEYGWEEFVQFRSCTKKEEIEDYYTRFGSLICILHTIRGCDFHIENIIVRDAYPIVVDLETIFHQTVPLTLKENAEMKAKNVIGDSVLSTALLPILMFKNAKGQGVDMSALNGKEQPLPFKVLQLQNISTEEMNFNYDYANSIKGDNIPKMNGKLVDFRDYLDFIEDGFCRTYRFFLNNKETLQSDNSPLNLFKNQSVRILARATHVYANFLQEATHPDYTREMFEQEMLYDRLWFYPFKNKEINYSEIQDLYNGDIPYFETNVSSLDLIDSNGRTIKDVFETSCFDLVLKRVKDLSEESMKRELELINISSRPGKTHVESKGKKNKIISKDRVKSELQNYKSDFVAKAIEIAAFLNQRSIEDKQTKTITWISKQQNSNLPFVVSPLSPNLYDGTSGMALFYIYLGKITGDEAYFEASERILHSCLQSSQFNARTWEISAFYGIGSIIYPTFKYQFETKNMVFKEKLDKYLTILKDNLHRDEISDYLSGSAGLIQMFLNLYESYKEEYLLEYALLLGNNIKEKAVLNESGKYKWNNPLNNLKMGGLSHGASGIALALIRLATYNEDFSKYGRDALEYDQSLYSDSIKGWKDVRQTEMCDSLQWCHGSVGIGLSRMNVLPYYNHESVKEEIKRAATNLIGSEIKVDNGLCHGKLGDSEFLLQLYLNSNDRNYMDMALNLGYQCMEDTILGESYYDNDLSLMNGLSGLGYQLLRMAYPDKVPSVLMLE